MNKKILALVLLVALALTLNACSSKDTNTTAQSTHIGTYEGNMEIEGMDDIMSSTMSQLEGVEGVDASALENVDVSAAISAATGISVELKADNQFFLTMMGQEISGTYAVEGTKLTLTYAGEPMEGTLENGTITMEQDGVKFVLNKK